MVSQISAYTQKDWGSLPFCRWTWSQFSRGLSNPMYPHVVPKSPEVGKSPTHVFVVCPTWTPLGVLLGGKAKKHSKQYPIVIQYYVCVISIFLWLDIRKILWDSFKTNQIVLASEPTCWKRTNLLLLFYYRSLRIRLYVLRILDYSPTILWPGGWDWDKINPTNFWYGFSRISGRNHLLESHDGNPRIHGTKGTFTYMNTININQM